MLLIEFTQCWCQLKEAGVHRPPQLIGGNNRLINISARLGPELVVVDISLHAQGLVRSQLDGLFQSSEPLDGRSGRAWSLRVDGIGSSESGYEFAISRRCNRGGSRSDCGEREPVDLAKILVRCTHRPEAI
ncbi:hypothetical protein HG530_015341 [Fusarium avenaceum]|nr:hypothetical protein HG530_015341 [Fusarium avenaceum]